MAADGGYADHLQSSRFLATCLVGGLVLGASIYGFCAGLPVPLDGIFRRRKKKPVRVYMDGCFDMMHYGHCNALRQARALGDQLVVGVVSDSEITANKGPPVTPLHERMIMVGAVKWVDEVIPDAPYAITKEFMNKLFNEYNIDYIIHGDDPCLLPDGTDAYALAKKAGRFKQIKRTEGVSSTDIVVEYSEEFEELYEHSKTSLLSHLLEIWTEECPPSAIWKEGPGPDARIVYMDGAFDLFNAGHVENLSSLEILRMKKFAVKRILEGDLWEDKQSAHFIGKEYINSPPTQKY
ncbi:Ethanolamine-phosphate cytidylyltransferase [Asimina triloba]